MKVEDLSHNGIFKDGTGLNADTVLVNIGLTAVDKIIDLVPSSDKEQRKEERVSITNNATYSNDQKHIELVAANENDRFVSMVKVVVLNYNELFRDERSLINPTSIFNDDLAVSNNVNVGNFSVDVRSTKEKAYTINIDDIIDHPNIVHAIDNTTDLAYIMVDTAISIHSVALGAHINLDDVNVLIFNNDSVANIIVPIGNSLVIV